MASNILKALSKNLGFKVLAVVFAFTLWIVVYNLEDPIKSKSLTINVSIANREVIEEMGKYYEVQDGTNKVSFSVTAARSILDKLDESDFVATANMEQLVISDDGTGTVPIEIICTANVNSNSVSMSSTTKTLKVAVEDLMTKQFMVKADTIGSVADGYALGDVTVTAPNVLKVSGPKSMVQQISSAVATIDVSGMSDPWTTYRATPILYDSRGMEIDATRLTLSDTTVNVEAEILSVKEVEIAVQPEGEVADGYMQTEIICNPKTIQLKGNKAVLNTISAVTIPEGIISVENATADVTAAVDISEYLPGGVELMDGQNASVGITVKVAKIKEKVFSVNADNIMVTGLLTNTSVVFELSSSAVTISGLEEDINALSNAVIEGSIDVTGLGLGTHTIEVGLDLDETKYTHSKVEVAIEIVEKNVNEDVEGDTEEDAEETVDDMSAEETTDEETQE